MQRLRRFTFDSSESRRAGLLFSYYFFIVATLLVVKPVANSFFIQNVGIGQLPIAFGMVALSSIGFLFFYLRLLEKTNLKKTIFTTISACIFSLIVFWGLYHKYNIPALNYLLYVWVALYGAIAASQFWLMANTIFDSREAKKNFGFIGAGGISGGIAGGYITSLLADAIGTRQLLLVAAAFLLINLFLLPAIWKFSAKNTGAKRSRKEVKNKTLHQKMKQLTTSPHVLYIAGIVGIGIMVSTLAEFQFRSIASATFQNKDELTRFFGLWQSNLSLVALLIQLFLTAKFLNRVGVIASLFILPVALLGSSVLLITTPVLTSAIILRLFDGSLKQSIYKAGMELLFLPIPAALKNQTKGFTDIFIANMATGISGVILLGLSAISGFSLVTISLINIALIAIWFFLLHKIRFSYVQLFRRAIETRTLNLDDISIRYEPGDLILLLKTAIDNGNERQILYILSLLSGHAHPDMVPLVQNLLTFRSTAVRIQALQIAQHLKTSAVEPEALAIINTASHRLRQEAMYYLYCLAKNKKEFLNAFLLSPNPQLHWCGLMCAARGAHKNETVRTLILKGEWFNLLYDETNSFTKSQITFIKVQMCHVIGTAKQQSLYTHLTRLLEDKNDFVATAAIFNAGELAAPEFVPTLIQKLNNKNLSQAARKALIQMGDVVIDRVVECLEDEALPDKMRRRLVRVLSRITSQKSADTLIRFLDRAKPNTYHFVLKGISRIKSVNHKVLIDRLVITAQIWETLRVWYSLYIINKILFQDSRRHLSVSTDNDDAGALLRKSINEKQDQIYSELFRLLGLLHSQQDMWNAFRRLESRSSILRANAIEFLENVLESKLKTFVIPVIEQPAISNMRERYRELSENPLANTQNAFHTLLAESDKWLKACTLHYLKETRHQDYLSEVDNLITQHENRMKQSAHYVIKQRTHYG